MRREILDTARATGFEGSILDLYQMANQGANVPEMLQAEAQAKQQNMLVAQTPQEQQVGLREQQAMGNTDASMVFPDVPANTSFNTEGMRVPINISKVDEQGHLVQSYQNVPPGIKDLPTGPKRGTVIETPAYQTGGVKEYFNPKKINSQLYDLEQDINESLGNPMDDSFNYSAIPNYDVVSPQYQTVIDNISRRRHEIFDQLYDQRHYTGFDEKVEKARSEDPILKDLLTQKKSLSSQYPTITRATEQPIDALRHTAAGYKTSKAIEDKVKNVPYVGGILDKIGADKLAGFVGSNLFGVGHEAMTLIKDDRPLKQKAKESYEDIYNNLMGSVVAASGKSEDDAMKTIFSLEKQGKLKKGQVKDLRKGGYRSEQYPQKFQDGGTLQFLSASPLEKLKTASGYAAKAVSDPFRKKIADNIYPLTYGDGVSRIINAVRGKKDPRDERTGTKEDPKHMQERTDFLRLHMGQDQKYNSAPKSKYKPSIAKDDNVTYYASPVTEEAIRKNMDYLSDQKSFYTNEDSKKSSTNMGGVLGRYTLSKGEDEKGKYVAYYDKYDFNPFDYNKYPGGEGLSKAYDKTLEFFGMDAPEIYGRVYYDEKTGKAKKQKGGYRSKYGKDPVTGTGKKPKGSGRRLYTDENPKDTVGIKFATPADARATVAKVKKVNKPFARKIQILTVGEQRAKVMGKSQVSSIFTRGKEALRRGRKRT